MEPLEGGSSLHHCFDNVQEGVDYLLLWHQPLSFADTFSLSFRIRHKYAPSSQNNWQVALAADVRSEPEAKIYQGIVAGVNFQGSDDLVKIWRVAEGEIFELCSTSLNYQEQVGGGLAPLFRLQGDGSGRLDLYYSPDPAGQEPQWLCSCHPEEFPQGRQFVLRYSYSSSRDQGLWMDRFLLEGHFGMDTIAPKVTGSALVGERDLQISFSERVVLTDSSHILLFSEERPGGVVPDSLKELGDKFLLSFSEAFPNRVPCLLRLFGLADPDGNLMPDTLVPVLRNEAQWGDLVFNEVMADPEPPLRYDTEYLELYNRSDYLCSLEGWELKVNERTYLLSAFLQEIGPQEFGVCQGMTLPNEGAVLSLYSGEGTLVQATAYKLPWDGPGWKKEGGWSLESPDPDDLCGLTENWKFSKDPGGGTPGRINSIQELLPDRTPPVLLYGGLGDPGEMQLHFSEPLRLEETQGSAFRLNPGGAEPVSVELPGPLSQTLHLSFAEDFQGWPAYRLSLPGLSDCAGNQSAGSEFRAGAVSGPVPASLVINEIMFDPEEGDPEYLELYLPGDRFYDLKDLAVHLQEKEGVPDHPVALSSCSRLVFPGQYLVLTACVPQLTDRYQLEESGQWVEVEELPAMNNSSGIIYLTDRAGLVVDMAAYSETLHLELLQDPRGISLERISADRPGSDPDNWHSAASIAGYATPGKENSQRSAEGDSGELLGVEPQVFSPDNDGYQDQLRITLATGGFDWVVGLWISDLEGRRIRTLANNHVAAPTLTYTWDGEGEDGSMQAMGFYVIHARAYHPPTGEQWVRRKAVGLVYR
ncbi:MAG: lamin tail domain-containing protein [Bacteroidales bacterium]|nr:lamin tail domain-containing protein [Bacteroidales bacterium]